LWAGQVALAAATLPKTVLGSDWSGDESPLSAGKFKSLVNGGFRVQLASGSSQWFTLLSVEDLAPVSPVYSAQMVIPRYLKLPASPKTETFALHFQSLGDPVAQGTYTFEHDSTGRLHLFIVPSGNSTYIAIVNRLVRS
jgi:hypothetical protein